METAALHSTAGSSSGEASESKLQHANLDVRKRDMAKQKGVAAMQAVQTAMTSDRLEGYLYILASP